MAERSLLILVGGGSASGKSTFCSEMQTALSDLRVKVIGCDTYFKRGHMPQMQSPLTGKTGDDFNTPEAVDIDALLTDLNALLASAEYDVILLEGVTALCFDQLRALADLKIFVDLDTNIRMYRRIKRNMAVRGLSLEEVADYFTEYAIFEEARFSLPSKIHADLILNGANYSGAETMVRLWIAAKRGGNA